MRRKQQFPLVYRVSILVIRAMLRGVQSTLLTALPGLPGRP